MRPAKRRLKTLFFVALLCLGVAALVTTIIRPYVGEVERRNVLTAGGRPELVVMDARLTILGEHGGVYRPVASQPRRTLIGESLGLLAS